MYNWDKRGNAPLYGACLGVAPLLFASWVAPHTEAAVTPPAEASSQN
jgi:hypothetical protein